MIRTIDYYFDFVSPFAYLAYQRLPALAERHGYALECHVVDLAELKVLAGNTGPTNRSIPPKTRYLQHDKRRWAQRYGVPIVNPKSYDCARLNHGFFFARDRSQGQAYVAACWRKVWGEGGDPTEERLFAEVAAELRWQDARFLAFTVSNEANERYGTATRAAHERGVFGVPTMMIGEEMWWGNDRLDFLEEYLAANPA